MKTTFAILLFAVTLAPQALGAVGPEKGHKTRSTSGVPAYAFLNINNVSTVFRNNGYSDWDTNMYNSGFVFPKGSHKTAVYASGFLWGGMVEGEARVGGSTYRTGLQPGKIIAPGVPEDPYLPKNRVYRVRPDYLTADLSAEVDDEGGTPGSIRAQYARDWEEWPAADGAPFDDRDLNGGYNPLIDIPGLPGAAQTIWYVCNDLDSTLTDFLYGSRPIGLEMQFTAWAYDAAGPLGNTIFRKHLLINKSGGPIGDMYVSQWVDPDVGYSADDYVGCDTAAAFGFAYNAYESEPLYAPLPPPAVGFDLLQGPLVPAPGHTGRSNGRTVTDHMNLPMTAFYYFTFGEASVSDPPFGTYTGTLYFYDFFQGKVAFSGEYFLDPTTEQRTTFALSGNPMASTGWVDGLQLPPSDRRLGLAAGPFTMAAGDSQEVIVAELAAGAAPGVDRLSAVALLKVEDQTVQSFYDANMPALPPVPEVHPDFADRFATVMTITADATGIGADSLTAFLMSLSDVPLASVRLYDDGAHHDRSAGDGVFGNTLTVAPQTGGVNLDCGVRYQGSADVRWKRLLTDISTAGPLRATDFSLASDNINDDGRANPGENIRYTFTLQNQSRYDFSNLAVYALPNPAGKNLLVDQLDTMASASLLYNPNNTRSYFTFDVPNPYPGASIPIVLHAVDAAHNHWTDTLSFKVTQFAAPVRQTLLNHARGFSTGDFEIRSVDPPSVIDHLYAVYGVDSVDAAGNPGFTLKDSTDGRIILLNHALPDQYGHNIPVTEGFKVFRGTVDTTHGWLDWQVPHGSLRWTWRGSNDIALDGFNGAIGGGNNQYFFSSVTSRGLHDVLIRFAATDANGVMQDPFDPNASYAYRYLRRANFPAARPEFTPYIIDAGSNWAYQDYTRSLPFAAFDRQTGERLMVGYSENNVEGGSVDGKYWPPDYHAVGNTLPSSPREWFYVFSVPYSQTPDPALQLNILQNTLPIMWFGTPARDGNVAFAAGDEFEILAKHPPSSLDAWVFNPTIVLGVGANSRPSEFSLEQNYPNPFNPATSIRYQVPARGLVTLSVYDVLGRRVALLVDGVLSPGPHTAAWNGAEVASGVYFYRLQAGSYSAVRKMLLLR